VVLVEFVPTATQLLGPAQDTPDSLPFQLWISARSPSALSLTPTATQSFADTQDTS
jgi:hypothetical protein